MIKFTEAPSLKQTAPNDFINFDEVWEFAQKIKITTISFINNDDINVFEPAGKGFWEIDVSGDGNTLVFTKSMIKVAISRKNVRRIYTDRGTIRIAKRSGAIFTAWYDG